MDKPSRSEKYAPSIKSTILQILTCSFLLIICFSLAAPFILIRIPGYPAWTLYRLLRWPASIITGAVSAGITVFLRRTIVEITTGQIIITSPGRRRIFALDQFLTSSSVRKEHIFSYGKYITVKCYLLFRNEDKIQKCRLYGFTEKELEHLLAAIRLCQSDSLTFEEKADISRQYGEESWNALMSGTQNRYEFQLPAAILIAREKNILKRISLIMLCAIAATISLDIHQILTTHSFTINLLFLTILVLPIPFLLLALAVRLHSMCKFCAEKIVIGETHLWIRDRFYSYTAIHSIHLTSPRKKSSSIFPVQRYIRIVTSEGKTKYWLGSEVSFSEYRRLCTCLEQALILTPEKLKYT